MSKTPTYDALEPRQQRFVDCYCTVLNASEAARQAGYKTQANVQGSRMLANDNIREAIRERLPHFEMGKDEVKARIQALTHSDMSNFVTIKKVKKETVVSLDLKQAKERGALSQLRKLKVVDGKVESIDLRDPSKALDILAQIHKLIDAKDESGSNDANDIDLEWDDA